MTNGSEQASPAPIEDYHDLVRRDVYPILPETLGRVLDFGGGVGATSTALKREGRAREVIVADQVSAKAVGVDKAFTGDLEDPSLIARILAESGPFETILALDVLEHLRDPWSTVRRLCEGLTPSGVFIASIPNVNYYGLVCPLVLRGRYDLTEAGILDRTHIRWFAKHGAIELMSPPGLKIEAVNANVFGRRDVLLKKLSFGSLTRFLALQYVIRARRVN